MLKTCRLQKWQAISWPMDWLIDWLRHITLRTFQNQRNFKIIVPSKSLSPTCYTLPASPQLIWWIYHSRGVLRNENRTMQGSLSLREARANVAEIKDLCLGHVTLRTLRPLLKKIQGHWHTNGVISITRVSLSARWAEPIIFRLEKTFSNCR